MEKYTNIESYMLSCMSDSAHDKEHVYRVLNYARNIAKHEDNVDIDVLITACLLHDISRAEQFADPSVDHASAGAEKAKLWLVANNYSSDFAETVAECIFTHRYRSGNPPKSIEAKILFDADKVDVCGAMGIVRTIQYAAHVSGAVYTFNEDGTIYDGVNHNEKLAESFFSEYKYKLEKIYDRFYTKRGAELGAKRRQAAADFYTALLSEVRECYEQPDEF